MLVCERSLVQRISRRSQACQDGWFSAHSYRTLRTLLTQHYPGGLQVPLNFMSKELTSTEKYYRTALVNQRKSESLGTRALSDYKHGDVRPSLGRHKAYSSIFKLSSGR